MSQKLTKEEAIKQIDKTLGEILAKLDPNDLAPVLMSLNRAISEVIPVKKSCGGCPNAKSGNT